MITKEQIEQAFIQCLKDNPLIGNIDRWSFKQGAELALEQCPYSREDMISFADFIFQNHHTYGFMDKSYIKLLKLWEEQK